LSKRGKTKNEASFFLKKAKKNECYRSSTIEDLPLLARSPSASSIRDANGYKTLQLQNIPSAVHLSVMRHVLKVLLSVHSEHIGDLIHMLYIVPPTSQMSRFLGNIYS
jgi:hypothetical protein